jgi:hypothetical protein
MMSVEEERLPYCSTHVTEILNHFLNLQLSPNAGTN